VSFLSSSDPLALLAIQAGQINAPADATAAQGTTELDRPQRFAQIGEPVPIVFARFRNSKGGILISPGATEARFENDASNNVTAYYMLVLSEGQLDGIPVKDVFQRACRVGAHTQTYNRRAGTWTPGNFLVQRAGKDLPEAPFFCGTVGSYPGISTLSFNVTIPDGFDQYNRQVHLFIRGGMAITRIYDSVTGPSDNFADLVKWLLVNTSRVPAAMIDDAALLAAATFLEVNGFTCNIEIRESTNYSDLAARLAPYFLLAESSAGGKRGLRPLLPVTAGGAIKTTAITAEYTFTEDTVLPGTLEINYLSLADRQPFVAQVIWRQQLESDIGIIRTAEVRYSGTAETGPYESHDLSTFCTSEDHAVKVGAYILAKRLYTTHTIRFAARPQEHNTLISAGDIIRVQLARDNTTYANSVHDYLYQVERITKTLAGDVSYEATHFPIDDQGRSLIALDVAAAVGTGIILPSGRTGVSCDVNSSSDNTIPAETFTAADGTDPLELSPSGGGFGFNDSAPTGDTGNVDDGLDAAINRSLEIISGNGLATPQQTPTFDTIFIFNSPCGAGQQTRIDKYLNGTKIGSQDGTAPFQMPYYSFIQVGTATEEIYFEVYCDDELSYTTQTYQVSSYSPGGAASFLPANNTYWRAAGSDGTTSGWYATASSKPAWETPFNYAPYNVRPSTQYWFGGGSLTNSVGGISGGLATLYVVSLDGSTVLSTIKGWTGSLSPSTPFTVTPLYVFEFSNNQSSITGVWNPPDNSPPVS
jgi:hypothetical protein